MKTQEMKKNLYNAKKESPPGKKGKQEDRGKERT